MARPVSWLSRLATISKAVGNSVRSHYSRRDLELLFKVKPKTASKLLELLATDRVGTSHLVSRDALSNFLDQVLEAEDVPALMERIRHDKDHLTRVKTRYLVPRDLPESSLTSLPSSVLLERGRLTIEFKTVEQLIERLMLLGTVMKDDPQGFQVRCEVEDPDDESPEAADARFINAQIEQMKEAKHV